MGIFRLAPVCKFVIFNVKAILSVLNQIKYSLFHKRGHFFSDFAGFQMGLNIYWRAPRLNVSLCGKL